MKFLEHIKLAGFIGLVTGAFHGTIDVIARLSAWSFEWFELYQTLLISSVTFTIAFILLCLIMELIRLRKDALFYFTTALASLICFYAVMYVNSTILLKIQFFNAVSLSVNLLVVSIVILLYIIFLNNGKIISKILRIFESKVALIGNYIFIIIIFIVVSFIMDLYLLNYISASEPNEDLKGYPNILFIVLDTVREDRLSGKTSPNFNELAKHSIVFDNAVSPSPLSLQSHATIFTGKYLQNHGTMTLNHNLNFNETTLAEILRDKGYVTAGFVGNGFIKGKYGMGQGFETYKDRLDFLEYVQTFDRFSLRSVVASRILPFISTSELQFDLERTAEETNKYVFKWLDKNVNAQPFFMFINYYDSHYPYTSGKEFKSQFTNDTKDFEYFKPFIDFENTRDYERYKRTSSNDINDIMTLYDIEIFYTDYHMGKVLERLGELGLKNNTIIIITSDHGEEFYEHEYFGHGFTLYEEAIHVPLIIYYPKEFEAKTIEKKIGVIDIFPTIFDMLDIEKPENIDGASLLPLMGNKGNYTKGYALSEVFGRKGLDETKQQISVFNDDWKLIEITQWEYTSSEEETISSGLYNLRTDPKEQRNLYDTYTSKRRLLQNHITNITKNT